MKHQQVAGGQVADPLEQLVFDHLLTMEALEVAGRSLNVRKELSSLLMAMFEGDACELVRAYQQCGATTLVAVHTHVQVLQASHALLGSNLPLATWPQIWAKADGLRAEATQQQRPPSSSAASSKGEEAAASSGAEQQPDSKPAFEYNHSSKVVSHSIQQVFDEVVDTFNYRTDMQRFVPAPTEAGDPVQQRMELYVMLPGMQHAYGLNFTSVTTKAAGYFSSEHLEALRRLGGDAALAALLRQLMAKINDLLQVGAWAGHAACQRACVCVCVGGGLLGLLLAKTQLHVHYHTCSRCMHQ